jgi:hypothetical protein
MYIEIVDAGKDLSWDDISTAEENGAIDTDPMEIIEFLSSQIEKTIFQIKNRRGYIRYTETFLKKIIEELKKIFETGKNRGFIAEYDIQQNIEPLSKVEKSLRFDIPVTRDITITYKLTHSFPDPRKVQYKLILNLGLDDENIEDG